MPLRDVKIRLGLDASGFIAGVEKAKLSTAGLRGDLTKMAAQKQGVGILGSSFGAVALGAAAAGASLVKSAANFDQAMANVNATGAASQSQMEQLRKAALDMGRSTVYSATQSASGMEALLKAGVSAKDVIGGGLKGALNLAAAGSMDVGDAAEIASSAMTQFALSGEQVPHIADLLAAGAGKAQGDVSDLGYALQQAGLVAHGAGANIEETTATLTAFASAGLIGSDAGTSFRTMLMRLEAPQGRARKELAKWNISAYDSKGNFVGMARLAGQLQRAFAGQSAETRNAALSIIFGQDAVRAANILYKQGEGGIKKWTAAVDDSGYAADVAAKKTDTLQGDLKRLSNAWTTLGAGSGSQSAFRGPIQDLTDLLNGIHKANTAYDNFLRKIGADRGGAGRNIFGGDSPGFLGAEKELFQSFDVSRKTGVKAETVIKFKTQGAANAVRDAVAVARAANLTPRQVRSVLRLLGWNTAGIDHVIRGMNHVDRRQVRSTLKLLGFSTAQIDAVNAALDKTDKKHPSPKITPQIKLDPIAKALAGLDQVGKAKPQAKASVKDNASAPLKSITSMVSGLDGKTATITITTVRRTVSLPAGGGALYGGTLHGFSNGGSLDWGPRARGAISGPGTETSDSIPAMLSNGEHVLTASDVRKAGGQDAIFRLRAGIQSGDLKFASGGAAGSSFQQRQLAIARVQSDIVQNRTSRKTEKGYWPRRVLDLEYAEDRRALYRLQHGVDESTNPADEVQSAIQSLRDAATAPVSLFDGASDSPWMQAGGFGSRAQQKLTQIRTLAGKLVQLRKAGLNGALLAEIYGLGSAQGIAAADELLRNRGEIRQLNAAYTGIQAANGLVAAASFQSPGAVGGVRISLDGVSFNLQDMKATVRVVARDEAGHVLAQDRFESVVH